MTAVKPPNRSGERNIAAEALLFPEPIPETFAVPEVAPVIPPSGGHALVSNVIWNLFGHGAPLLVALLAIPLLIKGLGTERFGVLVLAWMVVGYFTLFDLGIGRATTKYTSEYLAKKAFPELNRLIWTSLLTLFAIGILGMAVIYSLAPYLVTRVLVIPSTIQQEAIDVFGLLAFSLPIVVGTSAARGILEAQHRFGIVNAIAIPAGVANYLLPLAAIHVTNDLSLVVLFLVAGRTITWLLFLYFSLNSLAGLRVPRLPRLSCAAQLFRFGGWVTVSSIIGPLMTYTDRFLVGSILTMSAVTYYATPYDLVTKLGIIAPGVMGVLFPVLITSITLRQGDFWALHDRATKFILLALAPIVVCILMFAQLFLDVWLGAEFAANSRGVLQILSAGVLFNSLAVVPFTAIHAAGRADLSAKAHLIELPLYLLTLWFLVRHFGIEGVAFAWLLRVVLDYLLMFSIARRLFGAELGTGHRLAAGILIYSALFLSAAFFLNAIPYPEARIPLGISMTVLAPYLVWRLILGQEDRTSMRKLFAVIVP
jgi:O-antigen/teichoic acid export membrane protein